MRDAEALSRERQALDIFDLALDRPDQDRAATLHALCAGDPALIQRVQRLLAAQTDAHLMRTTPPAPQPGETHAHPAQIGPYRLVEPIGEGGMGAVFRAERTLGGFAQTVAIKLIRGGLFSAAAAERFAQERTILASLHHPHITRLFDGGTTEDNQSYIVMELVDGAPITEHATAAGLNLPARLALFRQVCDAAGHAHQSGVVHADIKPGNVLIDPIHGAKLLDFGISALVAANPGGDRKGGGFTSAYASPQRLQGARPTPADDIFALGCLLLALTDPCPKRCPQELRAIVAKSCAPEPRDRYSSCGALADDICRLSGGFPVHARPSTRRRTISFFWRRHPWASSATIAAAFGLAAAVAVTTHLEIRAQAARAQADQRFVEVRALSRYLLDDVTDELQAFPGTSALRRDIATRSRRYLEGLSRVPDAAPDLALEAALGTVKTGLILGLPDVQGLGNVAAGKQDLAQAEAALRRMVANPLLATRAATGLAQALSARASIARTDDNDPALSRRLYQEAASLLARAIHETRRPADLKLTYARALTGLAELDNDAGAFADMLPKLDLASAAIADLPPEPDRTGRALTRAAILNLRGDATYFMGNPVASLPLYQKAAATLQAARGGAPDMRLLERSAFIAWNVESVLVELGRNSEGLAVIDRGVADAELMRLFENSTRARHVADIVHTQRAEALAALGRSDDAVAQLRSVLADARATAAAFPASFEAARALPVILRPAAEIYRTAGRPAEACAALAEAQQAWRRLSATTPLPGYDIATELPLLKADLAACHDRLSELVPRDSP